MITVKGVTSPACYVGDVVAAFALSANESGGYVVGKPWHKWNVSGGEWAAGKSHGIYLDTSKPINNVAPTRAGIVAGTVNVLPNPFDGAVPMICRNTSELLTVLTNNAYAYIVLGPGTYVLPDMTIPLRYPTRIVGSGPSTKLRSKRAGTPYASIETPYPLYIESCDIGSNVINKTDAAWLTLTDCVVSGTIANCAGLGHGGGPMTNVTAVRCKVIRGGGFGIATPFLFSECVFSNSDNFPHNIAVNGGSGAGAFHRCIFNGSARGIVINNGSNIIRDDCVYDNVIGDGNGAEADLIETSGNPTSHAIVNSLFRNNVGPGIEIFALLDARVSGFVISGNRFENCAVGIVVWGVTQTDPATKLPYPEARQPVVNGVSVFDNYMRGGKTFIQVTDRASNVMGDNNVFVEQVPSPDHNWNLTPESMNPMPLIIDDGRVEPLVPNKPDSGYVLRSNKGGFSQSHVGCTWKNSDTDWHQITAVIDVNTIQFSNWITPGTTGIKFTLGSIQPASTVVGKGNIVSVTVIQPYTKRLDCGDAKVKVMW